MRGGVQEPKSTLYTIKTKYKIFGILIFFKTTTNIQYIKYPHIELSRGIDDIGRYVVDNPDIYKKIHKLLISLNQKSKNLIFSQIARSVECYKNKQNKQTCCIVIPCYKENLEKDEEQSLMQCTIILKNFNIYLIAPNNLDLNNYAYIFQVANKTFFTKYFEKKHFVSIASYNHLMLDKNFYKQFCNYNFMLIYQLDAWVFKDELEFWCNKGFDYIGAPWFINYDSSNNEMPLMQYSGNGGFSLRNIKKMYKLLSMDIHLLKTFSEFYKINKKRRILSNIISMPIFILRWLFQKERFFNVWQLVETNEDDLIVKIAKEFYPNFKVATSKEAIPFAFECKPHYLFKLNGYKLPFGCHAYKKYNWNFWSRYITYKKLN